MTSTPTTVYIRISDVFPHIKNDFETFRGLLKELSLTDTLFWCARLNMALSTSMDITLKARQEFGLKRFLTSDEMRAVNDFVRKRGGPNKVIIFFRGQILELLRWVLLFCHDLPDDGITFEKQEVRLKFAQAAFIASDIWAKRVFEGRFSVEEDIDRRRQKALGPIRKSTEATGTANNLAKSLGRGSILFEDYFPKFYKHFEDEFHSKTNLSVNEYFICFAAIITSFMDPQKVSGLFNINELKENAKYGNQLAKYIDLESQTVNDLKNALWKLNSENINSFEEAPFYDYRPLRDRPILSSSDGRAIIIDPILFSEKASIGPLFHLLGKQVTESQANTIFGAFGDAFESYACDILKRMYPHTPGFAQRLSCKVEGYDEERKGIEIDAYLHYPKELVLFEMKSAFIPERAILSDSHEDLIEQLRERYSVTNESSSGQKIKGVGQLARIIKSIAAKTWLGKNDEFNNVKRIYPILVVHDSLLTSPVYGNFFASEFKNNLEPDNEQGNGDLIKENVKVTPVIVLSIEDLEDLETSIEHFALRELLSSYSHSCPDRVTSLHDFMGISKEFHLYHNRNTAAKAQEIIEKCMKAVFNIEYSD